MAEAQPITELLDAHRAGDEGAFDDLMASVYGELQRLARSQRRRSPGGARAAATLDTSALVHEAYLKLAGSECLDARDREHFLAVAARAMRQVVVDYARHKARAKRGGGAHHTGLGDREIPSAPAVDSVLAVAQTLERLAGEHPRMVRVVECRWFAGLSEGETSRALGISLSTVQRDWREAKRLLRTLFSDSGA